jgi:hypothetical protein
LTRYQSFYGIHLFDPNGNSLELQTPFIMIVILLSLATYAMAGWGLWLVGNGHQGDMNNKEVDRRERVQGQAIQSNETDGLVASKGNGCLSSLRRRGKNSEAV